MGMKTGSLGPKRQIYVRGPSAVGTEESWIWAKHLRSEVCIWEITGKQINSCHERSSVIVSWFQRFWAFWQLDSRTTNLVYNIELWRIHTWLMDLWNCENRKNPMQDRTYYLVELRKRCQDCAENDRSRVLLNPGCWEVIMANKAACFFLSLIGLWLVNQPPLTYPPKIRV